MRAFLSPIVAVALSGCDPQQPNRDAAMPAPVPTQAHAAPTPASLPGEYRIAGIDGRDIDQPYAITASISATRIHVTADCLNFAWRYVARGDRIETERVAVEACGRGLTAVEEAVVEALDSASRVARTPANAIELRGGGHVVTLFSQ